jgi:D-galactarolactone cycloisomerase
MGGAVRDRVRAYATGCYYSDGYSDHQSMLSSLEEEASSYADDGFEILKMKVGLLPIPLDAERVAVVRRAIGDERELLVDANHAYNAATAVRMGRVLEQHRVSWFEEPVVPEDLDGYRQVRSKVDIPIAGGEAAFTRFGFRDLIAGGCVDIAQPDVCVTGGLSEFLKIQALASTWGVQIVPHVWGSGVALAAALHALAVVPPCPHTLAPIPLHNEPIVEYDRKHNPLRDELLTERFDLDNGYLRIPTGPGLGVTVDETLLSRYTANA